MSFELKPGYYEPFFDDHTNEIVRDIFDRQQAQSWQRFITEHQVPNLSVFEPSSGKPVQVFDMRPAMGHERTVVYHGGMGDSLDSNVVAHLANVSIALNRAFPEAPTRLISTSNPGRLGNRYGKLTREGMRQLRDGDFRPTVEAALEYAQNQNIEARVDIGYSFGADKAVAAANYAEIYGQNTTHAIVMEPSSLEEKSLIGLGSDFFRSGSKLNVYAEATGSQAYLEARLASGGLLTYSAGLLRKSNWAITNAIRDGGFEERVNHLMNTHPEVHLHLIWGEESELTNHGLMTQIANRFSETYSARLNTRSYTGLHHAHADDLRLHTATIIDAFKQLSIGSQKSAA
jgi:hypothetical protein